MEIWRDIPGYEGFYQVSNMGKVWSFWSNARPQAKGGQMNCDKSGKGYPRVQLSLHGEKKRFQVHCLVMLAFVGPPPPKHEVNHKNGKVDDPRLENLEYVTKAQNLRHAFDVLGRIVNNGSDHGMSKLDEMHIPIIRGLRARGQALGVIAAAFGVNVPTISMIVNGKTWRHVDKNYTPPKRMKINS